MNIHERRRRARKKLQRHVARLNKTGECSAWLAAQAQKRPMLMARLFPVLSPPRLTESQFAKEFNGVIRKYWNTRIREQLEQESLLFKELENDRP